MSNIVKTNFNFIKGDTFTQGFTISNFDLDIDMIYFTVKEKSSDKNYVLQKRLGEGIKQDSDNKYRYVLNIAADDTNNMKTNYNYVFDIEIIIEELKYTIVGGNLRLDDWDITSKANEV